MWLYCTRRVATPSRARTGDDRACVPASGRAAAPARPGRPGPSGAAREPRNRPKPFHDESVASTAVADRVGGLYSVDSAGGDLSMRPGEADAPAPRSPIPVLTPVAVRAPPGARQRKSTMVPVLAANDRIVEYLPVLMMLLFATGFAALNLVLSWLAGAKGQPEPGEGRRVRVRSPPDHGRARPVQREVLPGGAPLRPVRHRGGLPLPLGGLLPGARAGRSSSSPRCSSSPGSCSSGGGT